MEIQKVGAISKFYKMCITFHAEEGKGNLKDDHSQEVLGQTPGSAGHLCVAL